MEHMEKKFLLGNLSYKSGNSSVPLSADNRVILLFTDTSGNIEDDLGKRLVKRWEKTKTDFRAWYRGQVNFKLGQTLTISVQTDTTIICLLVFKDKVLDTQALKDALITTGRFTSSNKYNVHINKADIDWTIMEPLVIEYFVKSGVNVTVYEP